jgi:hypothetical protein
MILTRAELLAALRGEIQLLQHLASKVDPARLDYRPSPRQRSTLELLRYLTFMGPIHCRAAVADAFDMDAWRKEWTQGEAASAQLHLDGVEGALANLPELFERAVNSCSDAKLRGEMEMFGSKSTRGAWLVSLVLQHYAAYRMQLFLYLKASGRPELNTLNLWAGVDGTM